MKGRLYYFGARWYDPELGLWISPDPAHQFNSPYAYMYDPIGYIDPYGLWSIGVGVVFGYDKHGFHVGLGAAADVDLGIVSTDINASHTWSTDGSQTTTIGAGAGVQFGILGGEVGATGSYNTEDSYSLNAHVGANVVAAGAEIGTNQAWDKHGNYLGGNVYGEGYLGLRGIASYGVGYQVGWGGFQTGWYQNASLLMNNWTNQGGEWGYSGFEHYSGMVGYSRGEKSDPYLVTERAEGDKIGHSAIVGQYQGEAYKISVGPRMWGVGKGLLGVAKFLAPQLGSADYGTHVGSDDAKYVKLQGLNDRKLYQYSKFLGALGRVPYMAATACSFYTSLGVMYAGGFSVGGNIHPYLLEDQMRAQQYLQFQGGSW